ncbi:MAG: hypothetical protein KTR13_03725 [Saprospiraceae bacterium]|nr:hypothetical protein [Saprospiraceae bacterium]
MAYIFYQYARQASSESEQQKVIQKLDEAIHADTSIYRSDNHQILYYSQASEFIADHNFSLVSGAFTGIRENWHSPEAEKPENFTFFLRNTADELTANTDLLASRTIWYYKDEEQFIISSSQLLIIQALGSFELNPQAVSWMVATGTSGPDTSWDKRIHALGANGEITLNKKDWSFSKTNKELAFSGEKQSDEALSNLLTSRTEALFHKASFSDKSFITLSGGVDSRVIASMCKSNNKRIANEVYTWGIESKASEKKGDIYVAKLVAEKLGYNHVFLANDSKYCKLDFPAFISNYALRSEARIDHFIGYLDGFNMWEDFTKKYDTNIRGDEVFGGRQHIFDETHVRILQSLHDLSIYDNIPNLDQLGLENIQFKKQLERRHGETLEDWRDRLFSYQNITTVQASLNGIKQHYVEVVNPFLNQEIIKLTRAFSVDQRSQKRLFFKAFSDHLLGIPTAQLSVNGRKKRVLELAHAQTFMLDTLSSENTKNVFGDALCILLSEKTSFAQPSEQVSLKKRLRKLIPNSLLKVYRSEIKSERIDYFSLVFRINMVMVFLDKIEAMINSK